ncbi:MAG TPA: hypothetical protein VL460_02965 [Caulobacteraceae bacterium]|nr:hypothetical protein [Caulobacteraceae bacterium]
MVDVFEEVEEQLRSARYQTIFRKGWPFVAGVFVAGVLVTLVVWAVNQQRLAAAARASETYQQALDAMARNDKAAAEKDFAEVAKSGPPAYKALALMQQAGLRSTDGKTAQAVALLDQAAAAATDPVVADAARLKAVYVAFDTASLADIEKRVDPLAKPGRPYSALAREALAMKRLSVGQTGPARQALSLLTISPDAGQGLQARANIAMGVIDAGQGKSLPAAAALPPSPVPPAPPPGAAPQDAASAAPSPTGAAQ